MKAVTNMEAPRFLTINGGSSSIKFSVYFFTESLNQLLAGEIKGIGTHTSTVSVTHIAAHQREEINVTMADHTAAANAIANLIREKKINIKAIGHRIVHGMRRMEPEFISVELLAELKNIIPYDPQHLPGEIELIEAFRSHYPEIPHIACFDTSFHTTMPQVAKWISIPRRFHAKGIQRYGFHGLSYTFLLEELHRVAGDDAAKSRVIMAHLGNGASLCAAKNGKSIDTSMGFTPTAGLPMSSRSGDLDPGVVSYLMLHEKLSPEQFNHLVNHESGLIGVSGITADMQELLRREQTDNHAAEAIDLFCYHVKKWIGSFAAALGGLDHLIFSGGIGENAPEVRTLICQGLEFLGIAFDESRNAANKEIISLDTSSVCVRVIKTNEELMIARSIVQALKSSSKL
jgi:acetate kinase